MRWAGKLVPSGRGVGQKLATAAGMLIEGGTIWLRTVEQTVNRMVALQEATDLEDWRKSM